MSFARFEHIEADAIEAARPDELDKVRCGACGAVIYKDDSERMAGVWLCGNCADAYVHIEAASK